jgi:hypothetical protein
MKILIVSLQILGGISLIPWFSVAGLSFIAFGSTNSTRRFFSWLYIISIYNYTFVLGISYWRAWSNFSLGIASGSILWSFAPLIIFSVAYLLLSQSHYFYRLIKRKS